MAGTLFLIATPIDEESPLEPIALDLLMKASADEQNSILLIEDLKPCRRRWLRFGLPRESIESFIQFNEHTQRELAPKIISLINSGKNAYLMSDGGLPAFCDPGQVLVRLAHEAGIRVTCTPHSNSISLAVALSGIDCSKFLFTGFLPKDGDDRKRVLNEYSLLEYPVILMDTPYRLKRTLEEIDEVMPKRKLFLGMDLNSSSEELLYAKASKILKKLDEVKREFIIILD
ncbi:SAM-dependent methyltransferase [Bacteriovorax sp. Seq25_V]|uniref:SAM-dependent methyltransferase n=1 Tax=Bacteriovorax sp. Seq25_V TaxID=1201288 RepID=UPI00038A3948|nr:SAM-dependent methyltransferase [Bacteriovorax sp. Seq25_V]EQC44870.1 S-adenosylmethionine-dependent methyltransferase, YraL family [Bacteriovorax sp. Seq25_V]